MAVKAKEALYEEESSDNYDDDEEEEEEELHHLHKRISQTYPLSEEALRLLHMALLSLNKPSKLHDNSLLSPLLLELKSLRTLIPPTQDGEGSTSCVITGTLNYLEQLSRVTQSLKEGMKESRNLSGGTSKGHSFCSVDYVGLVKVESISNAKLRILVHCKKRKGLLSSLIFGFETLGLVIEDMDISCNDAFMMDATTTQVGEKTIGDKSVREVLWKIIHEGL